MITLVCPYCGTKERAAVPNNAAGSMAQCGYCAKLFKIPAPIYILPKRYSAGQYLGGCVVLVLLIAFYCGGGGPGARQAAKPPRREAIEAHDQVPPEKPPEVMIAVAKVESKREPLAEFKHQLGQKKLDPSLLADAQVDAQTLRLTMAASWESLAYNERLEIAEKLAAIWDNCIEDRDKATFRIHDSTGAMIGAKSFQGVWVRK